MLDEPRDQEVDHEPAQLPPASEALSPGWGEEQATVAADGVGDGSGWGEEQATVAADGVGDGFGWGGEQATVAADGVGDGFGWGGEQATVAADGVDDGSDWGEAPAGSVISPRQGAGWEEDDRTVAADGVVLKGRQETLGVPRSEGSAEKAIQDGVASLGRGFKSNDVSGTVAGQLRSHAANATPSGIPRLAVVAAGVVVAIVIIALLAVTVVR